MIGKYLEEKKGYVKVEVKKYPIRKNTLIVADGYPMRLRGADSKNLLLKNGVQLVLKPEHVQLIHHIEKYLENKNQYEADEKFDGFSEQELNILYDDLTEKMKNSIYKKRPANQAAIMEKGRKKFQTIELLSEKAKVLNEILILLRCDANSIF